MEDGGEGGWVGCLRYPEGGYGRFINVVCWLGLCGFI